MNLHPNTECDACQRVRDCRVIGDRMLCGECAESDGQEAARERETAQGLMDSELERRKDDKPHRAEGGR